MTPLGSVFVTMISSSPKVRSTPLGRTSPGFTRHLSPPAVGGHRDRSRPYRQPRAALETRRAKTPRDNARTQVTVEWPSGGAPRGAVIDDSVRAGEDEP